MNKPGKNPTGGKPSTGAARNVRKVSGGEPTVELTKKEIESFGKGKQPAVRAGQPSKRKH